MPSRYAVRRPAVLARHITCALAACAFLRWASVILHWPLGHTGSLDKPPTGGARNWAAMVESTGRNCASPSATAPSKEASRAERAEALRGRSTEAPRLWGTEAPWALMQGAIERQGCRSTEESRLRDRKAPKHLGTEGILF
ncbi:hypothetical protein EOD39_11852 [Acipenser ruthenus]|uniref:Uncharacterized protein n=1 Tax=Acipenser ruthenus TaxID=7906 RepID=A0A662YTS7_ACIRT|nr:hypothetical protein EOD39_11852 [Acipenser ruthenus]